MFAIWKTIAPHVTAFTKCCFGTRLGSSADEAGPLNARPSPIAQQHRVDRPHMPGRMQRKPHQRQRASACSRITDQDDPAPVVAVGHVARGQHEEDSRREQRQPGQAQIQRRMRDLVHLPGHRDRLRLRAQNHQQPRRLVEPEVARQKRAACACSATPPPPSRSHPLPYRLCVSYFRQRDSRATPQCSPHQHQIHRHPQPRSPPAPAPAPPRPPTPSRLPRSRAQLPHQLDVPHRRADVDDYAQRDQCHARPQRQPRGVRRRD